jgi:hypothetical protein
VIFSFGNNQKFHGAISGEYGGWCNLIIDFLFKNAEAASMTCVGAMS